MSALDKIDHFVVLMLENRSFDNMLGKLYPKSDWFDGLSGDESNLDAAGRAWPVNNRPGLDDATMSTPDPDPGELFTDINMQIFGDSHPAAGAKPNMSGFVKNYMAQAAVNPGAYDPSAIMHYFTPDQVPVISALARQFAASDRWFAAAPCQTWPNRFFVHTATAHGYENNSPEHFPYTMPTIYNRIDAAGLADSWKIYFHDIPQSMTLERLVFSLDQFRYFAEFITDAHNGTLPAYSFIEPRYFSDVDLPCDQHPPHVVTLGEQLIAKVYNALRNGPAWTKTLLIITYDEHGGCYDHVAPPNAAAPGAPGAAFDFARYGVRVPAILISPYIRQGTVLRPPGATPFDHTSIIATLRKRFPELGGPLTQRDASAPDLSGALILDNPDNMGPLRIDALPYHATPANVAQASAAAPNGMQKALLALAANLPKGGRGLDLTTFLDKQIAQFAKARSGAPSGLEADVASSIAFIKTQLGALFRNL